MSEASDSGAGSPSEDSDLKMINARRMLELRKRMNSSLTKKAQEQQNPPRSKSPSDREILLKALFDRGDEVLKAAEASYPKESAILIAQIAIAIKQGKISTISGGELLQFFRSIGMRVSVNTSISVQEHGKFVSLGDKLKRQY
ncbi:MAG: DNA-binding protein [Nitrososphaerales archaeon]